MIPRALPIALALALVASAAAFSVPSTGAACSATRLSMIPDRAFDAKLKNDPSIKDADRATILECDDTECAQIVCEQDSRGNWKCSGGLEGDEDRQTTKTVLMVSMDDGE